jgi:hypothetical protein
LLLTALAEALFLVVLPHGARRHFLRALAIATRLLRALLDVFVHALILGADTGDMVPAWHLASLLRDMRSLLTVQS